MGIAPLCRFDSVKPPKFITISLEEYKQLCDIEDAAKDFVKHSGILWKLNKLKEALKRY